MQKNWPNTMRAAVLRQQKTDLSIEEIQLPEHLDYGQVMVKVFYSGICGSQIGEIDGVKGDDPYLPHLLGHEGVGAVVGIGPKVKNVGVGDTVIMHWMPGRGINAEPAQYKDMQGNTVNAGNITTFNEYAVVAENRLTTIDSTVDKAIAPLFGCAVTTGLGVINNDAQVKIGDSIIIWGAGGVGLNMIQGAALCSAHPIIAIDIHDNRLELARQCGATHCINSTQENVAAAIQNIVGRRAIDTIIDNTGNPEVISQAYELVGPQGKVVLVGVPKKDSKTSIYTLPLHFGKTIRGSKGGQCQPSTDIPKYLNLLSTGMLKLSGLVTARFSLEQINDAILKMRTGEISGRCVVELCAMNSDEK